MLKKRVNDMPQELGSFFRHILASAPREYHRHMATYFRLVLDANSSRIKSSFIALMNLSFLDDQLDSQYHKSIGLPARPMNDDDILRRLESMNRRIKARCKGLLEAQRLDTTSVLGNHVQFLHRTVYDFLGTAEMAAFLDDLMDNTAVELLMLKACVSFYKSLPDRTNLYGIDMPLLRQAMYYAHKAERKAALHAEGEAMSAAQIEAEDEICQAVDDLRTTASTIYLNESPEDFDFPRMAAQFGLCGYISANIDAGSDGFSDIQSLLNIVLKVVGHTHSEDINFLDTVSMLLHKSQLQAQPILVSSDQWFRHLDKITKDHKLVLDVEFLSYQKQFIDLIIPHVVDVNAYDAAGDGARPNVPWGTFFFCVIEVTRMGRQRGQSDTCMQILEALFSRGADPNGHYANGKISGTIWSTFCNDICHNSIRENTDGVGLNFLASVTVMLLKAGADTDAHPLPREAVRAAFPPRLAGQICKLLPVHQADTNKPTPAKPTPTKPTPTKPTSTKPIPRPLSLCDATFGGLCDK